MPVDPKVASFVTGFLRRNREIQDREEERAVKEVRDRQKMQQALALERYKAQVDRYTKDTEMARKLESAGSGSSFAQVYYSGLAGIPVEQVRKDLDPNTQEGKRNLEWFEDENNRKAVLSYLRGVKKPTFNTELDNEDFSKYVAQRRQDANVLLKLYRKGTGRPISKIPNVISPKKHEERLREIVPDVQPSTLSESLSSLGLTTPSLEQAPAIQKITPRTYYSPEGEAVTAFTVQEAKQYEDQGMSPVNPRTADGSKLPITLYNKETGESQDLRPDDPMVDKLIKTQKWTRAKPQRPTRVRNIMPSEADQIDNFIEAFSRSDSKAFSEFKSAWEEADKGKERDQITGVIYSRISELRAMPEYQDEGLEFLTNLAIQDITPRIEMKDWAGLGGLATDVIIRPEGDEASVAGDEAPAGDTAEPPQDEKPPVPQVKLGPNEKLKYYAPSKRYAVVDVRNNKTLRWAD